MKSSSTLSMIGVATAGALATYYLRERMKREEAPDEVLAERVRAKLGRVVTHPRSIEVSASGDTVTLFGPVLARQHRRALRAVSGVPGVHHIVDRLGVSAQPGNETARQRWAPATRLFVGLGGAAMTCYGLARRSSAAPLLLLGGIALFARAATNRETKRLLGPYGRGGIHFTKTLSIAAPVAEVFGLWRDFENFPRFMRNVRRVQKNADGTWHWEVAGPLGATVDWDADVTQLVPNELIGWSTVPGSAVQHAGSARFQEEGGGTRVQIDMCYAPPAGALGHVIASLFGADPRREIDEDLMRMKSLFETGKPARDAAQPAALP
jgi:uncharacterized membrane protein